MRFNSVPMKGFVISRSQGSAARNAKGVCLEGMFSGINFKRSKIVSVGHTLLLMLRISGRVGMMERMSMRGWRDGIGGRHFS